MQKNQHLSQDGAYYTVVVTACPQAPLKETLRQHKADKPHYAALHQYK